MPYKVEVKPQAEKDMARIPNPHRQRIRKALLDLASSPRSAGYRKLAGSEDVYRIRVGVYRVVYKIVDRVLSVYVIRVAHRKDAYRGM